VFFYFVESPRYLLGNGETERALASINWIARCNGKKVHYTADNLSE
jgi:hypothetical protein